MLEICQRLRADIPEILTDWEEILRQEVGNRLPRGFRLMDTADVVLGIVVSAVCDPVDEAAWERALFVAASHGTELRAAQASEDLLFQEYSFLRRAMWYRLQWLEPDPGRAIEAITRIDQAITLATMATLHGYHRPELEAAGSWVDAIQRIFAEAKAALSEGEPTTRELAP